MTDEETVHPVPYVAFVGVLNQVKRMASEGIPDKVDRKYLDDMAEGTQFQYRQAFRYLGLTTNDDQPTPLLSDLVRANSADRRELFGKIMSTRWPDLMGLPLDASSDDFFAALQDHYGVTSDVQRRKMRTFFVAGCDYARLRISPYIRPTKARPGPRKPAASPQIDTSADQPAQTGIRAPEVHDISLGDAGSVSIIVNVSNVWELSEDQFAKLRKLIKEIEALGESGS